MPLVTELKQHETRNKIRERLPLRLSLIGGMIDAVIRNQQTMTLISKMLIQLISSGLVAVDTGDTHDDDLFYTTFDMLAVILWNCLGGDAPELYTSFIRTKDFQSLMTRRRNRIKQHCDKTKPSSVTPSYLYVLKVRRSELYHNTYTAKLTS